VTHSNWTMIYTIMVHKCSPNIWVIVRIRTTFFFFQYLLLY